MPSASGAGAATVVATGLSLGLTGALFGAPIEALALGLLAAVLSVLWQTPQLAQKRQALTVIAIACVIAGFVAPPAAEWIAEHLAIGHTRALENLIALVAGIATPHVLPATLHRLKRAIGGEP